MVVEVVPVVNSEMTFLMERVKREDDCFVLHAYRSQPPPWSLYLYSIEVSIEYDTAILWQVHIL